MSEPPRPQSELPPGRIVRLGADVVKLEVCNRPPGAMIAVYTRDHRGREIRYNLQFTNRGKLVLL